MLVSISIVRGKIFSNYDFMQVPLGSNLVDESMTIKKYQDGKIMLLF